MVSKVFTKDMETNTRTNRSQGQRTVHTEWKFDDGEVFTETHKNTLGGWVNSVRRVEDRCGARVRPADESGTRWTVGERTATTCQVHKA